MGRWLSAGERFARMDKKIWILVAVLGISGALLCSSVRTTPRAASHDDGGGTSPAAPAR